MSQTILDFGSEDKQSHFDFVISDCNAEAGNLVKKWPYGWADSCLLVTGSVGSGKSHLARAWSDITGARIMQPFEISEYLSKGSLQNIAIDNVDRMGEAFEKDLFHLYNFQKERGGYLLLTSSVALADIDFGLADLRSRIASGMVVNVREPSDEMMKILLVKFFSDFQLSPHSGVIDFLVPRISRNFVNARKIVEKLNKKSIETKRNITIPFVKEIISL